VSVPALTGTQIETEKPSEATVRYCASAHGLRVAIVLIRRQRDIVERGDYYWANVATRAQIARSRGLAHSFSQRNLQEILARTF
jgi:hypothetical protein